MINYDQFEMLFEILLFLQHVFLSLKAKKIPSDPGQYHPGVIYNSQHLNSEAFGCQPDLLKVAASSPPSRDMRLL